MKVMVLKTRKVPQRMCVVCRTKQEKKALIRVVRTPEGEVVVDYKGKANGRGAYLCKTKICVEGAKKTKALKRALSTDIPDIIYQELMNVSE